MKILFVNDKFLPETGAVSRILYAEATALLQRGHTVCIFTTSPDNTSDTYTETTIEGVCVYSIRRIPYHGAARFLRTLRSPRQSQIFRELLTRERPDIVHFHNVHQYLSYDLYRVAKRMGIRTCMTAHDVMSFHYGKLIEYIHAQDTMIPTAYDYRVNWLQQLRRFRWWYNPVRRGFIKRCVRSLDRVWSVSTELGRALEQNGLPKASTLYNGIDMTTWERPSETRVEAFRARMHLPNQPIILFGGRLSESKGGLLLLQAFAKIRQTLPDACLVIAGTQNAFTEDALRIARDLGVHDALVFTGWLDESDLCVAYHCATVVVTPSICFDSLPTMNMEAMACKKPVVSSCFGGAREVVQDGVTGYIVNPHNIDTLAEKITLCCDADRARVFGEAGYKRVETMFTSSVHANDLLAHYTELISQSKKPE